jgi:hypothetical protein
MTASTERVLAERVPARRVPDFFIVGQHKSGTTALYEMLRRHPQIYMPDVKEPRFFASDLRDLAQLDPDAAPETLEAYLSLFDAAEEGQRVGEASPSYLRSLTAASAIAAAQPGARIIAILREPASFIRSLHLHLLQEGVETNEDFRAAFLNEQIVRDGRRVRRYTDHLNYVEQLRRYHAVFPREQVLVLIYDDFRRDNEATLRRVLRFLGVDDTGRLDILEANRTVRLRSGRLAEALRRSLASGGRLSGTVMTLARALTSTRMRRGLLRPLRLRLLTSEPPPPDDEFMLELRRRFKGEVVALSEYLGRDLVSLWGYDDLG